MDGNMMQQKVSETWIYAIPGFLMKRMFSKTMLSSDGLPSCNGATNFELIAPEWYAHENLISLARSLAEKIERRVREFPDARHVVYGFSIGADIVMEILIGNMLSAPSHHYLDNCDLTFILTDPNQSDQTCRITKIAMDSGNLTDFRKAVRQMHKASNGPDDNNIRLYLEALDENKDPIGQRWGVLRSLSKSIVKDAGSRYANFLKLVDNTTGMAREMGSHKVIVYFSEPAGTPDGDRFATKIIPSKWIVQQKDHWYYCLEENVIRLCMETEEAPQ